MVKKIIILALASIISVSSLCACSVDDLKGNGKKEEEVDKHKLYEGWMEETGINLDENMFCVEASSGGKNITIKSGRIKRKDIEIFGIMSDNTGIQFCRKRDQCYLQKPDGSYINTNADNEMLKKIKQEEDRFTGGFGGNIKVSKSKYTKTVKEGKNEYDIIKFRTPDYKAQAEYEAEQEAGQKVVDDGNYGNDVGVIISDGKDNEEETKNMDAEAYVGENGEVAKIIWTVSGTAIPYAINGTEIPDIKNPKEVTPDEFLSVFMDETKKY